MSEPVTERLSDACLARLDAAIAVPRYDRSRAKCGIVHLGIGAFHRAHQAVYTDQAMNVSGGDWCITGVSLRSNKVARELGPQDGLYSVLSEDGEHSDLRVIGAVKEVLVAPRQPEAVVEAIASPATRVVTLTVTEKGYCLGQDGRVLALDHPDIAADLEHPGEPRSAIGLLARGLVERARNGAGPLTVISCDNLSDNGRVLESAVRAYTTAAFPEALPWLADNTCFPCTMVDRIVPAATAEQRARQSEQLGCIDAAGIATEPFSQWIIENRFAADCPDWAAAGAQFVEDIRPFETIKLRLLNASHSAIAYCGLLAGAGTVDAVMSDPLLGDFIRRLMSEELMPRLQVPPGFDLQAYQEALLARFANPRLAHRCAQIAMDGSEKIRQRWLPALQQGGCPLLLRALSAWCHVVLATDLPLEDPRGEQLLALRGDPEGKQIDKVLVCAGITPEAVPGYGQLRAAVKQNMDHITGAGLRSLLAG